MNASHVYFQWRSPKVAASFRTGVSLHSHTLHSRECLSFISRVTKNVPYLAGAIRQQEAKYFAVHGRELDMTRAYWTPPLGARQAWAVESGQIENALGLQALVSLSDHDCMEAAKLLSISDTQAAIPISVEWTVPFRQTFFHIGIHNVPRAQAAQWMKSMEAFTARPAEAHLRELLTWFGSTAETLVVLNHPMWDEKGIGAGRHWSLVREFLRLYGTCLHALELNGLRPWKENRDVLTLARSAKLPAVSGGDRHAREPNACVNLTNAATFAEFVEEVRRDAWSDVLFLPQYREPFKLRIIQGICEVMRDDPEHGKGWTRWSDRVFYLCEDGRERSLSELFAAKIPGVVNQFVALMGLAEESWLQSALRMVLTKKEEPAI